MERGRCAPSYLGRLRGTPRSVFIDWCIEREGAQLCGITVGADEATCLELVFVESKGWRFENYAMGEVDPVYSQMMARGLYRLGFEDQSVWSQLPFLCAHEKLELRLSLPREFWPKPWLDEEG